ncbi:MAG: O-antigen ligase family protein [Chitinophagaceae bacterium]
MIAGVKNKDYSFGIFAALFILVAAFAAFTQLYYLAAIPFILLFFYEGWRSLQMIFLILLFALPFSAEFQFSETLGTDLPDEFLMIIVSVFFFCYWIYRPAVLPKKTAQHPLIILLLISLCWSLVSVLFSTTPLISFKFLLAKSWYIGAFVIAALIFFTEKQMIRKAITALVAAMVLVTIITMVRHSQYALKFADINKALQPFFRNHVNYSALLVCIIPILFAYWRSVKKAKSKIFIGIIVALMLVALYFSYARGAWLALITGIIAGWLIKRKGLVIGYIVFIVVSISVVFWIKSNDRYLQYAHDYKTTIWHENFEEHLAATYHLKDASTAERFYRWIAGVRMIKDRPLTGFGPNSFYNNYKPYTIPLFKTWVSDNKEHSTVHNYFLLIAIEQGIPGLIIFLVLAGMMLYYAQHLYHRVKDGFYKTIAIVSGVVLTMIITVNFLSDLIETDKIGSLFFLCLSILVVTDVNTRKELDLATDIQRIP